MENICFFYMKKKIFRFICFVILFKFLDRVGKLDMEMIIDGLYLVGIEFFLVFVRIWIKL